MALNLSQIQQHFLVIGKAIYISQLSPTDIGDYQKAAMGTIRQTVLNGNASEYAVAQEVLVPLLANVKSTITALNQVPTNVKTVIDSYLKRVVGPAMGMASTATALAVINELIDQMGDADANVEPSGDGGSNDDGFAMYFYNNYAVELPQEDEGSIPDAYIDDDFID